MVHHYRVHHHRSHHTLPGNFITSSQIQAQAHHQNYANRNYIFPYLNKQHNSVSVNTYSNYISGDKSNDYSIFDIEANNNIWAIKLFNTVCSDANLYSYWYL